MYISAKNTYMLNIIEIHHSYVPLCSLEDFDKIAPAVR